MTKRDYTHVEFVLDRSGSMSIRAHDTIKGFNRLLDDQARIAGACTVGAAQFDHEYQRLYDAVPIAQAPRLTVETYQPRGWTALHDAVCRSIDALGQRFDAMPERDRPAKVVVVIITDGVENASREHDLAAVRKRVTHQRERYGWQFVFLGADLDSMHEAVRWGVPAGNAAVYVASAHGVAETYSTVSANLGCLRSGTSSTMAFDADQRRNLTK